MGSSSINTFAQQFNSKYLKHVSYNINKPQLSLLHPIISEHEISLKTSSNPKPYFHFFKIFPLSHIPYADSSYLLKTTIKKNSPKVFLEKVVVLLVGSFVLMGCCLYRGPALAKPTQKTSVTETQNEEEEEEEEEEEMYVKILEKNPRDVEVLKVLVYGKMGKGKTKEAAGYVERLIDIEPNEVEWRLLQALCFEIMGNLSKAKRLFKEILEERPLFLRALHGLAMVMHKNHEGRAVSEMLDKALEVACHEKRVTEERSIRILIAQMHVVKGLAMVMHKNHEGRAVSEMLDKALEVACHEKRVTEERSIRILIAQMHVVKGELEDGLKKFQDLIDDNPRDFRPYLCQGVVYSLLDKKKEAEEQFETYRSLVPEEFPQRGFLDDVVLEAKLKSQERPHRDFEAEFINRK